MFNEKCWTNPNKVINVVLEIISFLITLFCIYCEIKRNFCSTRDVSDGLLPVHNSTPIQNSTTTTANAGTSYCPPESPILSLRGPSGNSSSFSSTCNPSLDTTSNSLIRRPRAVFSNSGEVVIDLS